MEKPVPLSKAANKNLSYYVNKSALLGPKSPYNDPPDKRISLPSNSGAIAPYGVRPNTDAINGMISGYSSQLVTGMKPLPKETPSSEFFRILDAAYDRYSSRPQKAYPDRENSTPPLTQGKLRGAAPNKEMLADLIASADKHGVSRTTMLALAANESMFGRGYRGGGRREHNSRGALQQNVVSGWNVDEKYKPVDALKFLHGKGVPNISLDKHKSGYIYTTPDASKFQNSVDSALAKHPEWNEQYRQANGNVRAQSDINYFDEMASLVKTHGISSNKFNPGDPDYPNKIKEAERLLQSDPVIQSFLKEYDKNKK